MIIDSSRAYFGSSIDIVSFVRSLVNYADQIGKNGVTVLADMGSFFCYNKLNDLIEYDCAVAVDKIMPSVVLLDYDCFACQKIQRCF